MTAELLHECNEGSLVSIDHPVNVVDWDGPTGSQGYQVYKCEECWSYWGCRFQTDPGTGQDNRWTRFPDFESIKRHY